MQKNLTKSIFLGFFFGILIGILTGYMSNFYVDVSTSIINIFEFGGNVFLKNPKNVSCTYSFFFSCEWCCKLK